MQGEEGGILPIRTESHLEEMETGTGPEVVLDGMRTAREDPNNFSVKRSEEHTSELQSQR